MSQYCIDLDDVRKMMRDAKSNRPVGEGLWVYNYVLNHLDEYEKKMRQEERNAVLPEYDITEEVWIELEEGDILCDPDGSGSLPVSETNHISIDEALVIDAQWEYDPDYDGDYPSTYGG